VLAADAELEPCGSRAPFCHGDLDELADAVASIVANGFFLTISSS
jgi:hypothetical protein